MTLPPVPVGSDQRELSGRIKQPPENPFMLGGEEQRTGWPWRIQAIKVPELEKALGYPLLPVVLLLNEDQRDGFVRQWHPLKFGPEKNLGYAVQWFGLTLALLIIYLVVNTRKVK